MDNLLRRRLTSEMFDRRFAWVVAFALLSLCTTLMLKMLPELDLGVSAVLVASVALGWAVIGWESPKMVKG